MSNLNQYGGAGIKSIQRGVINITAGNAAATATITAVVTAKSKLMYLGQRKDTANADGWARLALTNTTTITATRVATDANTYIGYQVVEYY